MAHEGRRWYLHPELRPKVRQAVESYPGGYRGVGKRLGTSGTSIHRLATGETKSSQIVPPLLKLLNLETARLVELTDDLSDEQIGWLRLLDDLKRDGKDPEQVEMSMRVLLGVQRE